MKAILVSVSILLVLVGLIEVSQATLGIYCVGAACWLGIMARIAQADKHQEKIEELLQEKETTH
ncbi:MAG: hypothetical protein ABSA51_06000 [Anaerolineaceae bacterium]|jgi:hypothetical protein